VRLISDRDVISGANWDSSIAEIAAAPSSALISSCGEVHQNSTWNPPGGKPTFRSSKLFATARSRRDWGDVEPVPPDFQNLHDDAVSDACSAARRSSLRF